MHSFAEIVVAALGFLLTVFEALVFAQWVLWLVDADPGNALVRSVNVLVEPALGWLRRRLPFLAVGGWDLSPLAALLICVFLRYWFVGRLLLDHL